MAKILVVTPRFPYPPTKGDKLRAYQHIRYLSQENRIFLISLSEKPIDSQNRCEVEKFCESTRVVKFSKLRGYLQAIYGFIMKGEPLSASFFHHSVLSDEIGRVVRAEQPEVVHCFTVRIASAILPVKEGTLSVDFIDALSLSMKRRAERTWLPEKWIWYMEMYRLKHLEKRVNKKVDSRFVTSQVDKEYLEGFLPDGNIHVVPNGVDVEKFAFTGISRRQRDLLVFTGNMQYKPNVEAVKYFTKRVFPTIRKNYPECRFQIAGASPAAPVRRLDRLDGVDVLGYVESIAEVLQRATVSVCPLQSGAGIQNKVLEAMATGTPVVASPLAVAGIAGSESGRHYIVAEHPKNFARKTIELLSNTDHRRKMGREARTFVEQNYRWSSTTEKLESCLSAGRE